MRPALDVNEWVDTWGSLVQLASNLALLGVTAWLSWITAQMARSTEHAGTSARVSAEAAQESARIAASSLELSRAQVEVDFLVHRVAADDFPDPLARVVLFECRGAATTVHDVALSTVQVRGEDGSAKQLTGGRIVPLMSGTWPVEMVRGMSMVSVLTSPGLAATDEVIGLFGVVQYTFGPDSPVSNRPVGLSSEPPLTPLVPPDWDEPDGSPR